MIINSSQNSSIFDNSNVKDVSGQKKKKLIINSNNSLKKSKQKDKKFIKKRLVKMEWQKYY